MATPSSRLDLILVPADPDAVPALGPARALGVAAGWWDDDGRAGPAADALVPGGFVRMWTEQDPRARLHANQQGGFAVRCPGCDAPVIPVFQAAARAWRDGVGPRALVCPSCGRPSPLEALTYLPPAAFARTALHLAAVGSSTPRPEALAALAGCWGPLRVVGRRTW